MKSDDLVPCVVFVLVQAKSIGDTCTNHVGVGVSRGVANVTKHSKSHYFATITTIADCFLGYHTP